MLFNSFDFFGLFPRRHRRLFSPAVPLSLGVAAASQLLFLHGVYPRLYFDFVLYHSD